MSARSVWDLLRATKMMHTNSFDVLTFGNLSYRTLVIICRQHLNHAGLSETIVDSFFGRKMAVSYCLLVDYSFGYGENVLC